MDFFTEGPGRWATALLMMGVIFFFSSRPGNDLPDFGTFDFVVKKGGHVLGYGLLSLAYWQGLGRKPEAAKWAWLLSLLYAMTDEYHQVFVPGRHPSLMDVMLFDGVGAALALWLGDRFRRKESL